MGYLCADFSLPRPLCSRVRSDVRERQTDVRQKQAGHNYLWTAGRTSLTTLADSHSFVGGQTKQTVYSQLCILRHRFVYFLGDMSGRVTTSRQTHERYRWSCSATVYALQSHGCRTTRHTALTAIMWHYAGIDERLSSVILSIGRRVCELRVVSSPRETMKTLTASHSAKVSY